VNAAIGYMMGFIALPIRPWSYVDVRGLNAA
jgi:hypothetical protein